MFDSVPASLVENFRNRPKIDLHRHREGSIRLSTLLELAPSIPDFPYSPEELANMVQIQPSDEHSVAVFLSKFGLLRRFYISKEIIQRTTIEVIEDAARDNVIYLELRISPTALSAAGAGSYAQVLDWVQQAVEQCTQANPIQVQLIALLNRHEPLSEAEKIVDLVIERKDAGFCGVDLAGNEAAFTGEEFLPLFTRIKQNGLHVSVHAGEWGPPSNVAHAIHDFQADRIGHGCRILEDEKVVRLARDKHIPFEVCLSSNVLSGVVNGLENHPLKNMMEAGLLVTINTDDPAIQQTTLSMECALAATSAGLTMQQVAQTMFNAAQAAFLPDLERTRLSAQITAGWQDVFPD